MENPDRQEPDPEPSQKSQSMNQCMPMLSMTGTFLSNQILPIKGKWEALRQRKLNIADLSLTRENDANEGSRSAVDMDMQGNRLNSSSEVPSWPDGHEHQHGKCSKSDFVVEVSTSGVASGPPSSMISSQDDEMLSWLQYPVDENFDRGYCSELFGDVPGPSSGVQTFNNRRSHQQITCSNVEATSVVTLQRPPSAEAAMALGAERAAGLSSQVGLEAFCKVRTSIQPPVPKWPNSAKTDAIVSEAVHPPKSAATNFPLYSVPMATATASSNFQATGNVSDNTKIERSSSFVGESVVPPLQKLQDMQTSPTQKKLPVKKEQPASLTSAGGSTSSKMKPLETDEYRSMGQKKYDPEPTITSSSGGSENTTEKSEKLEKKRKATQMTDSLDCQSEDVEGESVDTKKPTRPKRSRAAEVHNLSERRRRDRINEKMRALQELIPNSNKTDKASMLDEAIEYLKMLQLQLQMMSMRSGLSLPSMVVPNGIQHMQMPQMTPLPYGIPGMGMVGVGMNMGMGMGMGMSMNVVDLGSSSASIRPMQVSEPQMEQYNLYVSQQQMQMPVQVVNRDMYNAYMVPMGGTPQQSVQQHHQEAHHQSGGFSPH